MPEMPNYAPTSTPPVATRKPANKALLIAGASFVIGTMLGIAGTAFTISAVNDANDKAAAQAEASKPRPLKEAAGGCGIVGETGADLGDGDHSLSLDGKGEKDYSGLSMQNIDCVLNNIHVPDFIRAEMGKTRALDGTQRESWDNFSVSWTYHPDDGLNVGLVEK